ncbi:MAG: phosphotransferase [Deltaproteobacteria bacterium]|nr:phosphotransferase [Deltaproteobacteria bacterium]MBW2396394.1 phosphotransferase [Deltaproteobacteria bacterium]
MAAFPVSAEAISPEWLTDSLSPSFPGVAVSAIAITARSSGTNSNAKLAVEYQTQAGAPATLFAKMPPDDPTQRELVRRSGMARRETGFYRDLAHTIDLRVPRAYFSEYEEASGDFLVLIEDLDAAGCSFPGPGDGFALSDAKQAMEDLAGLHLSHFTDESLREKTAWIGPPTRLKEYGVGMLEVALQHCRAALSDEFADLAQLYAEHHDAAHDVWEQGAWTIIHGDCHWGNLFLDRGRIGFLDWGLMATMPGLRDVSFFLCLGLTVEGRRRHERGLIATYLECVKRGGGPEMSEDVAWEQHRLHAAYTVPASAPAAVYDLIKDKSDFDPAVVAEFMRRSTAAITDLHSLEALRSQIAP